MSWFEKLMPSRISTEKRTRSVPEGVWIKCPTCDAQLYRKELERNLQVCPKCDYHMRIGARKRLDYLSRPRFAAGIAADLEPQDPLKFRDSKRYRDRYLRRRKRPAKRMPWSRSPEPCMVVQSLSARSSLASWAARWALSLASNLRAPRRHAAEHKMPLISFSASGGARMQEALFSLLQMAKTSAALAKLWRKGHPVCFGADGPDDGRRVGKSGDAWRRQYCRAEGA